MSDLRHPNLANIGGHAWPCGFPRCATCGKQVQKTWGSAEWHAANDPIEGYCSCVDNKFRELAEAVKKSMEAEKHD